MQKIAIDLGYGDTKVKTENMEFKFPSAVQRKKTAMVDYATDTEDLYKFNGKEYFVGEKAMTNAVSTRGFNFLVKYSPLVIYHAIKKAKLDTSKPIQITTGLSIANWNDRESFVNSIKIYK